MTTSQLNPGLRFLLSAACLVIVVAGLRGANTILVPLALALFVAVVSLPLLHFVRRQGLPTGPSILIVVLFDAAALFVFGWLVSIVALEIRDELPLYIVRAQEMEDQAILWITGHGVPVGVSPITDLLRPERLFDIISAVLRGATDILTGVFLVSIIFVFILAEASTFPRKLRVVIGEKAELGRLGRVVKEIQSYLAIKTVVSAATGLSIGVITWGLGLDFPLLWGLLAFLLNYIPNVGSIIAALPAIAVALLQIGPGMALLVAVIYLGVNFLFGNLIEPLLVGYKFGISTLVVILSLVFWGWVWGAAGMFLSVPLTMALKIGLEHSTDFKWVAYLMTAEPRERVEAGAAVTVPPSTGLSGKRRRVVEEG